ncbi:MAG: 6-bladed beta-propeller, partial [Candidatus Eisenbacteria bacterium]|nr:6-bladed beta-propeller [Candidatus Eisenbacteria bacterium]
APVWPAPPDPARIRWVGSLASGDGARATLLERVRSVVLGAKSSRLARPLGVWAGADGTVLVSDPGTRAIYESRPGERGLRTFAVGGRLQSPVGVARTAAGEARVADADRGVLVRYGRRGEWKGEAGGGLLVRPTGLAWDEARGRLYVADAHAHRISLFDGAGNHLADYGRRGTGEGEFNFPTDVKLARDGDLLVCDALNCRIQRLGPDGSFRSAFGRAGDGRGDFARPKSVAADAAGHVYVMDTLHDVMQVFDPQGRLLLVVGGSGAGAGRFNLPAGIAVDGADRIYVADSANRRVQVFQVVGGPEGETR